MFDNEFLLAIFILFCFLLVYILVNRICDCFERCATAKSYGRFVSKELKDKVDELTKTDAESK